MDISKVFVTVGTTKFEELIEKIDSFAFFKAVADLGAKELVVQIGKGEYIPKFETDLLECSWFRLKDSIVDCFDENTLAIGHAGAGTVLTALRGRSKLIIVPNESLSNNHQVELASTVHEMNYAFTTCCDSLIDFLKGIDFGTIVPFPQRNRDALNRVISEEMF